MIAAWLARMNQRERMLVFAMTAVVFLLANLFIWSALLGMSSGARSEYAEQRTARSAQKIYLEDEKMWKKRADWLKKNQPKLKGPAEASSLLDQVKDVAGKYNVELENPQIGPVENTPLRQSVSATFETKSGWEPLVHLLYDTQKPEAFTVFEMVNLMVDSNDPTVMKGRFKIAKWFAGTGKK